jgi:hypothetical protein
MYERIANNTSLSIDMIRHHWRVSLGGIGMGWARETFLKDLVN